MKRISTILSLAVMSIALLSGCAEEPARVTGLQITPDAIELAIGAEAESEQLDVSFEPADALNKELAWSSENAAVAIVDEDGLVTAVSEGTTNVVATAADGGKTAKCAVTVTHYTAVEAAAEAIKLVIYPTISTTGVTIDFDLITDVTYLGYAFDIQYTAVNDPLSLGYTSTFIAVSETGDEALITPPYSNQFEDEYAMCRLSAVVLYDGDSTGVTKNYNVRVNTLSVVKIADIYSANDGAGMAKGAGVAFECYYLGMFTGNIYQGVFVGDGDSAILLYGLGEEDLPESLSTDTIFRVVGSLDIYGGLMEVKPEKMEVLASSDEITKPNTLVLNESAVITFADQNRYVSLSGTVKSTDKGDGRSGITIVVTTGTKDFQVYCHKTNVDAEEVAAFEAVNKDDVISVNGFVGIYSGNYQIVAPSLATV